MRTIALIVVLLLTLSSVATAQATNTVTQAVTFAVNRSAISFRSAAPQGRTDNNSFILTESELLAASNQGTAKVTFFASNALLNVSAPGMRAQTTSDKIFLGIHKEPGSFHVGAQPVAREMDHIVITVTE